MMPNMLRAMPNRIPLTRIHPHAQLLPRADHGLLRQIVQFQKIIHGNIIVVRNRR